MPVAFKFRPMTNPIISLRSTPILAVLIFSGIVAAQDANTTGSGTTNYWAEVQKFRSDVMNERSRLAMQYESELLSTLGPVLDPTRLKTDSDFRESRELLEEGKSVVKKYEAIFLVAFDNSADQVQQLNLSEAEKRRAVTAYERGMAQSKLVHQEIWRLEHQKVNEIAGIIELLSRNRGSWTVDENRIHFGEQALLGQWNERFANINALDQEQKSLRNAAIEAQGQKAAER